MIILLVFYRNNGNRLSVILKEGSRIFSFSPFKKYLIPSIYCGKGITHRIDKLSRLCQVCKMKKSFQLDYDLSVEQYRKETVFKTYQN